jgi:hypothetical protein
MFTFIDSFTCLCSGDDAKSPDAVTGSGTDLTFQENKKNYADATKESVVDPMDAKNYLITHLSRPMGILFEENYEMNYGGAFVTEINEGGSAAAVGSICRGDQLIAIGDKRVIGMDFDEVMKLIHESVETKIKVVFFKGPVECLYGPTGASKEWLDEFAAERGEEAVLVTEDDINSEVMPGSETFATSQEGDSEAAKEIVLAEADPIAGVEANVEKEADEAEEDKFEETVEKVVCETEQEDAPILYGAVNRASKEWLNSYFENAASKLISDETLELVDTHDKTIEDLETRVEKAIQAKDAALAAGDEEEKISNAKGILRQMPRYSTKAKVEQSKQNLESSPVDVNDLVDDETSAASLIWSETGDFIKKELFGGEEYQEVPMKSVAAMGVASASVMMQT